MFNTISPKVRVLQRLPLRILVRDSKEHNTGMFWAKYDLCIKGGFISPVTHSSARALKTTLRICNFKTPLL